MNTRIAQLILALVMMGTISTARAEMWLEKDQLASTVYFTFTSPARIERFDMNLSMFSATSIALAGTPTATAVDASGIYVAFGVDVYRLDLNGANPALLLTAPLSVESLLILDTFLIVHYDGDQFISADKSTGAVIDTVDYQNGMMGLSAIPASRQVFGSKDGGSPRDIIRFNVNVDGTFGLQNDSLFHGELRIAHGTFANVSGGLILDTSGTVYSPSLELEGSLGGPVVDAAFSGSETIVARGSSVVKYGEFLETGLYVPLEDPMGVAIYNNTVFAFYSQIGGAGVAAESVALIDIEPAPAAALIDPVGHLYVPDAILLDATGLVYLLSAAERQVFVWSSTLAAYIGTIPLRDSPDLMTYASDLDTLFFGYESGKLTQVDLGLPLSEEPFVNTPHRLTGLGGADEWVFAGNGNEASLGRFYYVHGASGVTTDADAFAADYSEEYIWEPVRRRFYHFQDDTSPNYLRSVEVSTTGEFGAQLSAGSDGSVDVIHPIRVSPDGERIIIGSGVIYDATLTPVKELEEDIEDAAWFGGDLFTLHADGTMSVVQHWDGATYGRERATTIQGTPLALLTVSGGVLVITNHNGAPAFVVLDGSRGGGGGGGGGGGCFIATAAYGTPLARELDGLRAMRDTTLLPNALGVAFADAYYRISPPIAEFVAEHPVMRDGVRVFLSLLLATAEGASWALIGLLSLGCFVGIRLRNSRVR